MKKTIIIQVICATIIFVIGYLLGNNSANNPTNTKVANGILTKAQTTNDSKEKLYKLGEEGQSGIWSIRVLDVLETDTTQSGDASNNKSTQQKFIVVHLQMINEGTNVADYTTNDLSLKDTKDKTEYGMNDEGGRTVNQAKGICANDKNFFGEYDKVSPNIPKETYIVFKVPKSLNISNLILLYQGDTGKNVGYCLK